MLYRNRHHCIGLIIREKNNVNLILKKNIFLITNHQTLCSKCITLPLWKSAFFFIASTLLLVHPTYQLILPIFTIICHSLSFLL